MDEPGNRASLLAEEIADQPGAWRRAIALAAEHPHSLAAPGRLALIGCGSSWHAAKAIAALREARGIGEADAFAASEAPLARAYDRVVAISRSGTTTEVRQALVPLAGRVPVTALVGDPDSPIAAAADEVVDLSFADDRSVVQSRFVTTVAAFARATLGEDVAALPDAAAAALEAPLPVDPPDLDRAVFLATGWQVGLADAAALVLRETAQFWAESYPAMEYRHGPISTAGPGAAVWLIGPPPEGLAGEVAATGATAVDALADPLAELVRVQRLALAIAEARGLDPDNPPHLTRAVVLEPEEAR
ncbi:MAG: SIS domain-containing protein [Solirubrobacterales bacterium]